MEVYFYCNYANSNRGFLLTKLCPDGLKAVSLFNSQDKGEQLVDRFFSYDSFRVLWTEIPENYSSLFKPETEYSFFGIRGLNGTISEKKGYLNIAFLACKDEKEELEYLVRGILYNVRLFSSKIFDALSAGGKDSYELDTEKFADIIDSAANTQFADFPIKIRSSSNTMRDTLKLAVYVGSWEDACSKLGPDWLWKICPKQAISESTYKELFNS